MHNSILDKVLQDQATYFIHWHYDVLVSQEQDNTSEKELSPFKKAVLKQQAVNEYKIFNKSLIRELEEIGTAS